MRFATQHKLLYVKRDFGFAAPKITNWVDDPPPGLGRIDRRVPVIIDGVVEL